jgi:hypothetical protein
VKRWWFLQIALFLFCCVFASCTDDDNNEDEKTDDAGTDSGVDSASDSDADSAKEIDAEAVSDEDSDADTNANQDAKMCEPGEVVATLPYDITWFVIEDGHAFFVLDDEIKVVDLSNPAAPKEAGSLGKWSRPSGIAVKGNHAYVAGPLGSSGEGLRVVEFDPDASFSYDMVGEVALPDWVFRIDLLGDYAIVQTGYISSKGALQIIDVSNPTAPHVVGAIETNLKGRVRMAVWENYVLVADGKLLIIDVSNPSVPAIVGELDESLQAYDVAMSGSYAMVRGEDSLHVVDLSTPSAPEIVSTLGDIPDTGPIAVHENYVLTDDEESVLYVVDTSVPQSPFIAAQVETQEDSKLYLQAYQGYAYLGWLGVAVVDFCSND